LIYLLSQTIEASASRYPDSAAFICGKRSVTYQELLEQTNQLANLLIERGVQKGDRVGVYLNRSLETAIAIYGIMRAGAVYVPLDPNSPTQRTQFLINDCNIGHLITNPAQQRTLQPVVADETALHTVVGLKADWPVYTLAWLEVFDRPADQMPQVRILEKDPAYLMYTSGSTGVPKGILHTHQSGLGYARLSADLYDLTSEDRVGNHAPLHFDISTFGYFSAPLVGATTVIVPDAHTKMPVSLAQLIEKERLTIWYSVPLALIQLLQQGQLEGHDMTSLRWVLFGGEPFPAHHLKELMELWHHCQFSNVYGPAEVNQCTYYHVPKPPEPGTSIPLGQVWNNTEMLIHNEQEEAVQQGEIGELLIRSITRMSGYWKQPELTQQSLYKRIAATGNDEVFYRTGDLVQLDSDGNLLFMGRKDRQIKLRGFRIELDEVTNVLLGHPQVEEAAVFTGKNGSGETVLKAAIIPKQNATLTANAVRLFMEQKMARYALPEEVDLTDTLPRTPNGKINLKQLEEKGLNLAQK